MSWLWRAVVTRDTRRSFREVRHGNRYAPVALQLVPTDELRVRWEPLLIPQRAEDLGKVYDAPHWRAENPIDRFFPVVNGIRDRRLANTPHVDLLRTYLKNGSVPAENDYVRMMRVRARLQGRSRSQEFLDQKVERLLGVFKSIRHRGYRAGLTWREPIMVFETPVTPPTDYYRPLNWEIADGHHRAAALTVLGIAQVKVLILRVLPVDSYDWAIDIPWRGEWWQRLSGPEAQPLRPGELGV